MSITPLIRELLAAYPNSEAGTATVAIYDYLLADIPPAELRIVIDQAIAESKYLPTVAEIREKWHMLSGRFSQITVTEAWAEVQRQILRTGHVGTPTFSDPITMQVVKAMGWRELCVSENQTADRAHFMRLYEQLANRSARLSKLLPHARALAEHEAQKKLQAVEEE